MLRALAVLAVTCLTGCSGAAVLDPPCGSQRSISVQDTLPEIAFNLGLVDERERTDGIFWDILAFHLDHIMAAHLHDAIPGHGDRILYDLSSTDQFLGDSGLRITGGGIYSLDSGIDALFTLVRTGATYLDVHTGSGSEPAIRVDLTDVQFEDWNEYYCS